MKENVKNSKDTPDIARTTWVSHGGKVSALSPILRKVLTGISVGQVMLVAVAAATLGVFVNSNVRVLFSSLFAIFHDISWVLTLNDFDFSLVS